MSEDAADFRRLDLYRLLGEQPPPIARIRNELEAADPAVVAAMLLEEPETVFLMDYYFRLLPREVGARLISDPRFNESAAIELFNCQIIRYFRSNWESRQYDVAYASILESYWTGVDKEKLARIFGALLQAGKSSHGAALLILRQMNLDSLLFLQQAPGFNSPAMLNLFKELGSGVEQLLQENLDLFDFVYRVAQDLKDQDYLQFLDEFTMFIVQLRVARTLADDIERHARESPGGKPPLALLVRMLEDMPGSAQRISLELLKQRGLIEPGLAQSLLSLQGLSEDDDETDLLIGQPG